MRCVDLAGVGVTTHAATEVPGRDAYLHDATKPGFSVAGHPFLAELGPAAAAVIEYLKTL